MSSRFVVVSATLVWTLCAIPAHALSAFDFSHIEHCVGPNGSGPVFRRWVGDVDTTAYSVVTLTADAARMTVNLKSGWKRSGQEPREVIVEALRRPTSSAGHIAMVPLAPADTVVLSLSSEADPADPGIATSTTDSYLFEFRPRTAASAPQYCVLTFGDVWSWSGDTLTYTSPLHPEDVVFTPGRLSEQPLKKLLYGGQNGPPQQLWLESLHDDVPVPRYKVGRDPSWTSVFWDGVSRGFPIMGNAIGHNLWLCSRGVTSHDREICIPLAHYQLSDTPLIVHAQAEAGLTQQVSLRDLAGNGGAFVTSALVDTPASPVTLTYEYNRQAVSPRAGDLRPFITSERDLRYAVGLFGSADVEHSGGRCPSALAQPGTVSVFPSRGASAFDIVGCIYERQDGGRWTLMAEPADGSPEQDFVGSIQFALCHAGQCIQSQPTSSSAKMGFRLTGTPNSMQLRATNTDGALLTLDKPAVLSTVKVTSAPGLPDAPLATEQMARIHFKRFTPEEWASQRFAACIASPRGWSTLGVTNESTGSATLMLWADGARTPVGDAQWKLEQVYNKVLLCPQLTDDQVQGMLTKVRDALVTGGSASLYMIQGGRLVGHTVMLTGPSRPTISGFELITSDGTSLRTITRRAPLPAATSLCVFSKIDWGTRILLDPSKIVLKEDNRGKVLLTFQSHTARPNRHPFVRTGKHLLPTDPWTYCSAVTNTGVGDALTMVRSGPPGVQTTGAKWIDVDEGAPGVGGSIPATPFATAVGRGALEAYHLGLAWGHVFAWDHVPPTEARIYVAAPLALGEYSPFHDLITLSGEAGPMVGLSFGRNVVGDTFTSRVAMPLSIYGSGCVSATAWRPTLHASPQLCLGFALDLITPKVTATSQQTGGQFGVEGFGFTPFISIGLGQF